MADDKSIVVSPIQPSDTTQKKINEIANVVNKSAKFTQQIPEIKETAKKAVEETQKLNVTMNSLKLELQGLDRRINVVEKEVGEYQCLREETLAQLRVDTDKLQTDMVSRIANEATIGTQMKQVQGTLIDIVTDKRLLRNSLIGVTMTLILAIISSAFFIGTLSQRVEAESKVHSLNTSNIEKNVDKLQSKIDSIGQHEADTADAIRELSKKIVISSSNENTFQQWYDSLTLAERRRIKRMLPEKFRK